LLLYHVEQAEGSSIWSRRVTLVGSLV